MEFKDKILLIRAKLNISQEDFAKEFGVAFVTVNRWENGHTVPTRKTMWRIDEFCRSKNITISEDKNV
ncbi:transcriptional regulator [Clostridia bacterium]|nr:transcriptional regulator [Clostridia bacterium]